MYRVYLRWWSAWGSEVDSVSRTVTFSPEAKAAFRALIRGTELTGQPGVVLLSLNQRLLMYHRFDRGPGEADWVDPEGPIRPSHDCPRGDDDGHL